MGGSRSKLSESCPSVRLPTREIPGVALALDLSADVPSECGTQYAVRLGGDACTVTRRGANRRNSVLVIHPGHTRNGGAGRG
jgi:hypothetical protein